MKIFKLHEENGPKDQKNWFWDELDWLLLIRQSFLEEQLRNDIETETFFNLMYLEEEKWLKKEKNQEMTKSLDLIS